MEKKTITIEQEKVQDLYNILTNYPAISKEQVIMEMNKCFGEKTFKPIDVTERIKTFEDACQELGEDHLFVRMFRDIFNKSEVAGANPNGDVVAYLKLRIITTALNEGWEPQFTEDEWRYYPWFFLWTDEELADKSEEWKQEHCLRPTGDYKGEWAGLACAHSDSAPSYSSASVGSRLCFKSDTLAEYAGKQFIDLWMPFYLIHESASISK